MLKGMKNPNALQLLSFPHG